MKKLFIILLSLQALASANDPMLDALNEGIFLAYNPSEKTLLHQGRSFHLITNSSGHLSEAPVVSIGMIPFSREIILLDPNNSPYLEQKYMEIRERVLREAHTLKEAFTLLANFVNRELFSPPLSTEEALKEFLHEWIYSRERIYEQDFTLTSEEKRLPVIPLEDFAKAKCGVCRHQAFAVGYYLDKMQRDKIFPPGETLLVRDEVTVYKNPIHHAWNLFISDDGQQAWHIDGAFGIIKDLHAEEPALIRIYGQKAIEQEKSLKNERETK